MNTRSLSLCSCSTRFTFGIESKRQSWLAYPRRKVGTYASSRNAIAIYTPREMLSPIFYFPQSPSIPCQQLPMPRISAIHSMRIKLSSVEGPPPPLCASSQPSPRNELERISSCGTHLSARTMARNIKQPRYYHFETRF